MRTTRDVVVRVNGVPITLPAGTILTDTETHGHFTYAYIPDILKLEKKVAVPTTATRK